MRKQRKSEQGENTKKHGRWPKLGKTATPVKHILHHFREMPDWEKIGSIPNQRIHIGNRKSYPDKVAPKEPTIDTMLIISEMAGNNENRNNPNDCVAIMKSIVIIFISHQLP